MPTIMTMTLMMTTTTMATKTMTTRTMPTATMIMTRMHYRLPPAAKSLGHRMDNFGSMHLLFTHDDDIGGDDDD